jgi:hypothetical protein
VESAWESAPGNGRRAAHHAIAQLAYQPYELRGGHDSQQVEDWLRAERELMGRYA